MLIDTHAHLTDDAFENDYEQVVKSAQNAGVEKIITSGFDLNSSKDAIKFAEKFDGIFCSVGFYPEHAKEIDIDALETLAKHPKVVAIGEIGLQYTDDMPDKETQKNAFVKQLALAHKLKLPVVIHCRDAYGDMIEILKENRNLLEFGGTFHCFSGSGEIAKEGLKLGLHISVGGVSTFKNASRLQETLKIVPLERILLETDCPYLSPHPFRGRRNEPKMVSVIAQNLAKIKEISVEELEKTLEENTRRLFKI